jgi:hypothetical protein
MKIVSADFCNENSKKEEKEERRRAGKAVLRPTIELIYLYQVRIRDRS